MVILVIEVCNQCLIFQLEHKLRSNAESSIKRREPTILKLVKAYNTACDDIHALIRVGRAPASAIPPALISREDLFKLDIDDDIWLDVAAEGGAGVPPGWLADEEVRQGIHLVLQLDRCEEEERRLSRERTIMQEWFTEEWLSIVHAEGAAGVFFCLGFCLCCGKTDVFSRTGYDVSVAASEK
jgi:hypothetical protein